jgi:hypothetical protein
MRDIDSSQTIARGLGAIVPPRAGRMVGSSARTLDGQMESQRQCAPMNREPPGRLNSGIEMRTGARYGHCRAISGGCPAWLLSRKCT